MVGAVPATASNRCFATSGGALTNIWVARKPQLTNLLLNAFQTYCIILRIRWTYEAWTTYPPNSSLSSQPRGPIPKHNGPRVSWPSSWLSPGFPVNLSQIKSEKQNASTVSWPSYWLSLGLPVIPSQRKMRKTYCSDSSLAFLLALPWVACQSVTQKMQKQIMRRKFPGLPPGSPLGSLSICHTEKCRKHKASTVSWPSSWLSPGRPVNPSHRENAKNVMLILFLGLPTGSPLVSL